MITAEDFDSRANKHYTPISNEATMISDLPRLYQLGANQVRRLTQSEQDEIFAEYRAYWAGYEGRIIKRTDDEIDLDIAWNVNRDDWVHS